MSPKEKLQDPLYFIAIIPPEPILSEVQAIKEEMANTYASTAALRSPPHITLHMPFRWPDKKSQALYTVLQEFAKENKPIPIVLKDFGAFPPRVIYVGIEENRKLEELQSDLLKRVKTGLNLFNGNYKQHAFHPHMTIAFRDLKPAKFKLAWEVFQHRQLYHKFNCNAITLLKHNGSVWEVYKDFFFQEAATS